MNKPASPGAQGQEGDSAFYYAGLDIGSATAKAVVIDRERIVLGQAVIRSGVDFSAAAAEVFALALERAGVGRDDVETIIATGYGRRNVEFADEAKTEITCHAKGCYYHFPRRQTIIDIGGQDNKIIKLADDGARVSFKMNRKCAAGTGAFLEEMAARLDLDINIMSDMAASTTETVELGAFCTVFSGTEVLEKIRAGHPAPAIVRGIYLSMAKRTLEMDSLEGQVVLTGGVIAHNPVLPPMFEELTGCRPELPPHPQLTGALGAALAAWERNNP